MIKSMTGFGRGEATDCARKFSVEMKAVNHRYFDVNIRLPRQYASFDSSMRSVLKEYIQRGKIDVYVTCEDLTEENLAVKYNENVAAQYVRYFRQMAETFSLENDIRISTLSHCPEVFTLEDQQEDEGEIWKTLEDALRQACTAFTETRREEGLRLREDLLEKLDNMDANVTLIEKRYPAIVEEYTQRIKDKVAELLGDVKLDESRLAAELVLFSDKICTDEETVRLHSHIASMKEALCKGDGIGRKLDFIAQEMNREANTILSKANDITTSQIAIELKTEIEKVREQIQNIE